MTRRKSAEEKTEVMTISIPVGLRNKCRALAERDGVSLSAFIANRLINSFNLEDHIGGTHNLGIAELIAMMLKFVEIREGKRWDQDDLALIETHAALFCLFEGITGKSSDQSYDIVLKRSKKTGKTSSGLTAAYFAMRAQNLSDEKIFENLKKARGISRGQELWSTLKAA